MSFQQKYSFSGPQNPKVVLKKARLCMYIAVCGPKASAKATGPIVFKFSQKLNYMPEWMHDNLF